jgi:hypothetical protein
MLILYQVFNYLSYTLALWYNNFMRPYKYISYINDLDWALSICPNCHFGTFSEHQSTEYRGWYKCRHCNYMELSVTHIARMTRIVDINHGKALPSDEIQQINKDI